MSFYMIVNSNQNLDYFPNNKPFKFWTHLQSPLNLKGMWKIALVDVKIDVNTLYESKDVYLYCNICGESLVDGTLQPLLRRISLLSSESGFYSFEHLSYMNVTKYDFYDVEFYIKDEHGDLCTFLVNPVTLTLHLKSYPFFSL